VRIGTAGSLFMPLSYAEMATSYEKMPEQALDDIRFDQPAPVRRDASRAYAICTTPRSGSWLLCRQLVNADLGVPSEYFNVTHSMPLCARWGLDPRDTRAYAVDCGAGARRRTASGGRSSCGRSTRSAAARSRSL
jgi:hypothetical protein